MSADADLEIARPRPAWSPIRLLACIRMDEVAVLQGAPLIGALFSLGTPTLGHALPMATVMLASASLVAHVFVLNDWAGIHGDLRDPARAGRTFVAKGASRAELGWLAIALLVLALAMAWLVNAKVFAITAMIAATSTLYSAPGFHLKGRPVLGSALHLVGGIFHFLLGYVAFAPVDARGVVIAFFFALVFTAGHLMHEARGYEGDALNGIRTNAVAFGKRRSFLAGVAVFTAAYAWLVLLAALGIVPRVLMLAGLLYPPHLWMSMRALRAGLAFDSLCRLQRFYRLAYAGIGATMILSLLAARA